MKVSWEEFKYRYWHPTKRNYKHKREKITTTQANKTKELPCKNKIRNKNKLQMVFFSYIAAFKFNYQLNDGGLWPLVII